MFSGLSAFPLTPLAHDAVDEAAFTGLIRRLAAAQVDSVTSLGSTGSCAYLSTEERRRVARPAVEHAGDIQVFVGIGALRTSQVLTHLERAQQAGASAVLLAPMTYQPLTDDDVFTLFGTVTAHSSVPVIVYDNPTTTHVTFPTELYGRIAELPGSVAGLLGASITAPHLLGPFIARRLDTARDGRGLIAVPAVLHGVLHGAAATPLPITWSVVPAVLLCASGLLGPMLTGGISSRLPAIAGPAQRNRRRAQSWDVAGYGLSGTLGPADGPSAWTAPRRSTTSSPNWA